MLRSIATCFGVVVGQHVCGVNMMIFYALTLFDTSGSGELTGSEQTLIVAAVQILVSLSVAFLVDLLGRRILLTLSSLLMGLFLILLGKYVRSSNRRLLIKQHLVAGIKYVIGDPNFSYITISR